MEEQARATMGTELQLNTGTYASPSWEKFYDIKSNSGFANEPNTIDITTMSATKYTQKIKGLTDLGNLTFDVNSSRELSELANSVKGDILDWRVIRKGTGEYHRIQGELVYSWADGSVNDGAFGTLTIIPSDMSDILLEPFKEIVIAIIPGQTITVGATKIVNAVITPSTSNINVSSSSPNVASVSNDGGVIHMAGRSVGKSTIKVKATEIGYLNKETTFEITVTAI